MPDWVYRSILSLCYCMLTELLGSSALTNIARLCTAVSTTCVRGPHEGCLVLSMESTAKGSGIPIQNIDEHLPGRWKDHPDASFIRSKMGNHLVPTKRTYLRRSHAVQSPFWHIEWPTRRILNVVWVDSQAACYAGQSLYLNW